MHKGIVTTWKDDRGFGFIESSIDKQKIFLHITAIRDRSYRPKVGDVIYYQLERDGQGRLQACSAWIESNISEPSPIIKPSVSLKPPKQQASLSLLPVLLLSVLPLWGALDFAFRTRNLTPLLAYPTMGFLTFLLYGDDKNRAITKTWRIPESRLHLCELLGGWIGALVAQQTFRHKTSKQTYQLVFAVIVALHLIFWFDWLFLGRNLARGFT